MVYCISEFSGLPIGKVFSTQDSVYHGLDGNETITFAIKDLAEAIDCIIQKAENDLAKSKPNLIS